MESIVYADGFMKSKTRKQHGCSVALFRDDELVFKFEFTIDRIVNSDLKKLINKRKITNNVMEYFAAMYGLLICLRERRNVYKPKKIILYMDSELIVNQLNDRWDIGNDLLEWKNICQKINHVAKARIIWISRKKLVEVLGH